MRTRLPGLLAAGLLTVAPAAGQVIDPTSCEFDLGPGELQEILLEVCLPGEEVESADIYLLADNTASTTAILDTIKSDATLISQTLLGRPTVDLQIGVGFYRDWPCCELFENLQSITDNQFAIEGAINQWTPVLGGDVSESQFYALHELATDPSIGWRPDAKRIIVWFGDSPAHDPICDTITGDITITESLVTDALLAAGPGGTTVIAISVPFSPLVPDELNNDPLGPDGIFSEDYAAVGCTPGGLAGQADRIAAATAGISTEITGAGDITDAILETIDSILTEVTVTVEPCGDIVDFVDVIEPPEITVTLPNDKTEEVCVEFAIDFVGGDCVENTTVFEGGLKVLVNGAEVAIKDVVITQEACAEALCLMYLGLGPNALPIPGGDPADLFQVDTTLASFPVLMDDIPVFPVPNDPIYDGLRLYFQVGMLNAIDFPADPLQVSNGLEVIIGQDQVPYGVSSGITLTLKQPPALGGVVEPAFVIEGM